MYLLRRIALPPKMKLAIHLLHDLARSHNRPYTAGRWIGGIQNDCGAIEVLEHTHDMENDGFELRNDTLETRENESQCYNCMTVRTLGGF
jgi:ribosomal protein S2